MVRKVLYISFFFCLVCTLSDFAKAEPKNKNQRKFGEKSFIKADTDKNGLVSEAEFLELQKQKFKEIDLNKDGSIDQNERKKAVVKKKNRKKKVNDNNQQAVSEKKEKEEVKK